MRTWSQSLIAIVEYFAPTQFVLSFDENCGPVEDILQLDDSKNVIGLNFPERMIAIANHQIYADWIYIWCLAHLADKHDAIKIILKKSLEYLPIYGTKLEFDKDNIINNLQRSKENKLPMWLVLFPEGTVISESTRKKSKDYAERMNMQDNRYTLLPRSTGLRLCTTVLKDNVEYIYDFTIGYSGIASTDIPEEVHTIQSIFFFNRYPKQVHVHIRKYRIDSIPDESKLFDQWVLARWKEKDELMTRFYETNSFVTKDVATINVPIKLKNSILELAQIWIFLVPYLYLLKMVIARN